MSSSRIIKSLQQEGSDIADFNFRQIGHQGGAAPHNNRTSTGFVPMDMRTEEGNFKVWNSVQREEPEPPGSPHIEITEEELEKRISDSFNSGLQEGKNLAERGLVSVFRTLRASSETIHNLREKVLRESEDELIDLIVLVARKVIIREITQNRSILAIIVQNAIAGLSEREEITVRINPDDYALVTTGRDELLKKELLSERFRLKPDPTIASGFCQVDTMMGTIDAGMDAQLEEIYRHLLEQRTESAIEGG